MSICGENCGILEGIHEENVLPWTEVSMVNKLSSLLIILGQTEDQLGSSSVFSSDKKSRIYSNKDPTRKFVNRRYLPSSSLKT